MAKMSQPGAPKFGDLEAFPEVASMTMQQIIPNRGLYPPLVCHCGMRSRVLRAAREPNLNRFFFACGRSKKED